MVLLNVNHFLFFPTLLAIAWFFLFSKKHSFLEQWLGLRVEDGVVASISSKELVFARKKIDRAHHLFTIHQSCRKSLFFNC